MLIDYTLTDADIGRVLGVPDGYLVNLAITTPPLKYEIADWDPGRRCWRTAYFVLRGSGDYRDIFSANPSQWGYLSKVLVRDQSLSYRGNLVVVCVPRGSAWSLSLSDIPNIRTPPPVGSEGTPYGDGFGFKHVPDWWQPPGRAEPEPVKLRR